MSLKPIRKISVPEVIRANQLLAEHIQMVELASGSKPALVVYKNGYDDKSIAAMIAADLSPLSISKLRRELYGDLNTRAAEAAQPLLLLAAEVDLLRKENLRLKERFNQLLMAVQTKIVDVKHLLIKEDDGSIPGVATPKQPSVQKEMPLHA